MVRNAQTFGFLASGRRSQIGFAVGTDVSNGCLGVFLDHEVPIDALVSVLVAGIPFVRRVVYCRSEEGGFAAGIAVMPGQDRTRAGD